MSFERREKPLDIDKQKRVEIFEDTRKQIAKYDRLQDAVAKEIATTKLYKEDFTLVYQNENKAGKISVVNGRTFKVAKDYKNVAVLNFASATNPGGGVLRGSNAQEECLCRCSTLYPCLVNQKFYNDYYDYHKKRHNTMYTDRILYTKDVIVFKDDIREPVILPEKDWYSVDVITCAAPNLREVKNINQNELLKLFKSRIQKILWTAIENGVDNIVLGAFGCGAFRNPPYLVARAFKEEVEKVRSCFDNIVFATLITPGNGGDENYNTFKRVFRV